MIRTTQETWLALKGFSSLAITTQHALNQSNHSNTGFFTVLLQDQLGGLQVIHQNQWVDVPPLPAALVVNIADLLQVAPIGGYYIRWNSKI